MPSSIQRTDASEGPQKADAPTPLKRGRTTQEMLEDRRGPGLLQTALRTLLGLAVVVVLLFGIYVLASALEGDPPVERAPWADRGAPDVKPAGLADQ